MSVTISKQAFALLDRRDGAANGQIHLRDIASIDKDGKNGLSAEEAQQAGLDPKLFANDIKQLNQTLKEFKNFDPSEVIFNSPTSISSGKTDVAATPHPEPEPTPPKQPQPAPDPGVFSPAEVKLLTQKFGLHADQAPHEMAISWATDAVGWQHDNALQTINTNAATIAAVGRKYNLNPEVIGAILYDEIRHVKPVVEDVTMALGVAKTFGLAQLGNQELVRQGFFDKDMTPLIKRGAFDQDIQHLKQAGKIPAGVQPRSLTSAQLRQYLSPDQVLARLPQPVKDKGRDYLMNPKTSIDTLGGQLARIRREQGMPWSEKLNSDTFQDKHQIARVAVFHSGRLNYGSRILGYMEIPGLKQAVTGKYTSEVSKQLPIKGY